MELTLFLKEKPQQMILMKKNSTDYVSLDLKLLNKKF